ncbi:HEPN/Toprim-associated domain-containing protein [Sphingobacterium sp.]|uniref:HEPN/Toprim-associated domain-containing protein n=1 Tax=Sphingobacterium sp. TaxID=341027 RepID=UPI0028972DEC|nr:HEPN/Toprim-associated domain-containing protein [Sphingobacterium sp.]
MGSYSQLTVAGYPIYSLKNTYDPLLVFLLFQKNDYVTERKKWSDRNQVVWGKEISESKGTFMFRGFRQSVKVCKERLEIAGTNLKIAKRNFRSAKKIAKSEGFYSFNITKVTFEEYLSEIADILEKKEKFYDMLYQNFRESLIVDDLGIIGQQDVDRLYSILSCLPEGEMIEYDLSDVINNGWVNEDVILQMDRERILVLTEGRTDVEFISSALKRLYPHLVDFYHFIDFDEFKVESSASALVKLITAFTAAKVNHPVIALFDNDTTGIMEMKRLQNIKLNNNVKVMRLPDIGFAKKYPTRGATGIKNMNINGLACGIEMYLGANILEKDGKLLPVLWKSYNDHEDKYQGEISDKKHVQDTFRKKIKSGEDFDLSNLDLVLKMIFSAFQN